MKQYKRHIAKYRLLFLISGLGVFVNVISALSQSPSIDALTDDYYAAKDLYYDRDYIGAVAAFKNVVEKSQSVVNVPNRLAFKIHFRLAKAYLKLDYSREANAHLDSSLVYVKRWVHSEPVDLADIYLNKGVALTKMMKVKESNEANFKALNLYKKQFGEVHEEVAGMHMHIGINHYKNEQYTRAENHLLKAKRIFEQVLPPESENWNRIYNNTGMVYRKMKNYDKALNFAKIALQYKLKHYTEDHPSVMKYYSNIYRVCRDKGDLECADQWNQTHLKFAALNKKKYPKPYGSALTERAELLIKMGRYDDAIQHYLDAHEILATYLDETNAYRLSTFSNLAICYELKGEYENAIRYLRQAQRLRLSHEELYFPHYFEDGIHLASLYKQKGEYKKAQAICDSMFAQLLLREKTTEGIGFKEKYDFLRIQGLQELAQIKMDNDAATLADREVAQRYLMEAINVAEKLHEQAYWQDDVSPVIEESYELYADAVANAYTLHETKGYHDSLTLHLLTLIEGSKGLAMRKIRAQRINWRDQQVPQELLDSIHLMNRTIAQRKDQFYGAMPPADKLEEIIRFQGIRTNLISKAGEYQNRNNEIGHEFTADAINTQQQALLRDRAANISYFLTENRGFAIYYSGDRMDMFSFDWSTTENDQLTNLALKRFPSKNDTVPFSNYYALYEKLWQPLATWLREDDVQRVRISPAGALQHLPFDILPTTPGGRDLLLHDFAISYRYSFLSEPIISEPNSSISYVGFAPVFDQQKSEPNPLASRAELEMLRASVDEVNTGSKLFSGVAFIEDGASESNFKETTAKANIIHIASHARADDKPANSGIYFYHHSDDSSFVEDDFLSLNEIYALDLDSELVILSACETGDGVASRSEGLLSLARGFSMAGCASVMMSQWRATDRSTARIVGDFLSFLKEGHPKDVALQMAKKTYLNSSDAFTEQPYFWAGLSLYGSPEPVIDRGLNRTYILLGILSMALLLVGFRWFFQKNSYSFNKK